MIELLESLIESISSFMKMLMDGLSYLPKFFTMVGNVFTTLNGLLVNMVPTWVGVFAIATIFISILWIILEII